MSFIFKRLYSLTIGSDVGSIEYTEHSIDADITYSAAGDNADEDLHKIRIYNAGPQLSKVLQGKEAGVVLRAGYLYEGGVQTHSSLPRVYAGKIIGSEIKRERNDLIVTLHCSAIAATLQKVKIAAQFPKGTYISKVFSHIASVLKVPSYIALPLKDDKQLTKILSLSGDAIENFKKLITRYGLSGYFFNGTLNVVHRKSRYLAGKGSIFTIPKSKILGIPSFVKDIKQSVSEAEDTLITFETTLDGRIGLGSLVTITIDDVAGPVTDTYTVDSVKHSMSLRGANWRTIVTAKKEAVKTTTTPNAVASNVASPATGGVTAATQAAVNATQGAIQ